ncbi:hypothetical protein [Intrasporangium flavum]|uniref:hypothetical protein n=1 Tax=Intrasporangium flavum TaxID=1428657 RepID=UPI001A959838|nr:hypothetical protein [Intrasporangium flavum]
MTAQALPALVRPDRDDRVLLPTRVLAWGIVPFLAVAVVLLLGFPSDTRRLFAWPISPPLTAMVLASAYLGGVWFFVRTARAHRWALVSAGLPAVTLFAALLGIATVVHWDRFTHGSPAFWVWAALYFVAPPVVAVVWVLNTRVARPPRDDERCVGAVARGVIGCGGAASLLLGVLLWVAPGSLSRVWPWALTPLTARVVGAVFCLGCAGLVAFGDPRWLRLRLLVEAETVMVVSMLLALLRDRMSLHPDRPLTWLLVGGMVLALAGSARLLHSMSRPEALG